MSLADEIFPDRRHPDFVQTEWARGWGYGSIGFAEAARFLTENRAEFHAGIDQVGLVVFFLQRHRTELALKELLIAHGVDLKEIKSPHSLDALWKACEATIRAADSDAWDYLDSAGTNLVTLFHEADPDSDAFRYPVDRKGNKHDRPKYIDLAALEKHVNALCAAIGGYMTYSAEARQYEEEERREFEQEMHQEYGEDPW
jgi:hypothetical protein